MKISWPNVELTPRAIIVLIGFIVVIGSTVMAYIINNEPIGKPESRTIIAEHVVDKFVEDDIYVIAFNYKTRDVFAATNPIEVTVTADLENVTTQWVILRFQGANRHDDSDPAVNNEVNMTRIHDFSFQGKGKLIYGLGGKWGAWLVYHKPNQSYGDFIEDVVEIAPADSLLQVEFNKQSLVLAKSQDKTSKMMLALTIALVGIGVTQLSHIPPLRKKPQRIRIAEENSV